MKAEKQVALIEETNRILHDLPKWLAAEISKEMGLQ
jgi:hypothetical protein